MKSYRRIKLISMVLIFLSNTVISGNNGKVFEFDHFITFEEFIDSNKHLEDGDYVVKFSEDSDESIQRYEFSIKNKLVNGSFYHIHNCKDTLLIGSYVNGLKDGDWFKYYGDGIHDFFKYKRGKPCRDFISISVSEFGQGYIISKVKIVQEKAIATVFKSISSVEEYREFINEIPSFSDGLTLPLIGTNKDEVYKNVYSIPDYGDKTLMLQTIKNGVVIDSQRVNVVDEGSFVHVFNSLETSYFIIDDGRVFEINNKTGSIIWKLGLKNAELSSLEYKNSFKSVDYSWIYDNTILNGITLNKLKNREHNVIMLYDQITDCVQPYYFNDSVFFMEFKDVKINNIEFTKVKDGLSSYGLTDVSCRPELVLDMGICDGYERQAEYLKSGKSSMPGLVCLKGNIKSVNELGSYVNSLISSSLFSRIGIPVYDVYSKKVELGFNLVSCSKVAQMGKVREYSANLGVKLPKSNHFEINDRKYYELQLFDFNQGTLKTFLKKIEAENIYGEVIYR